MSTTPHLILSHTILISQTVQVPHEHYPSLNQLSNFFTTEKEPFVRHSDLHGADRRVSTSASTFCLRGKGARSCPSSDGPPLSSIPERTHRKRLLQARSVQGRGARVGVLTVQARRRCFLTWCSPRGVAHIVQTCAAAPRPSVVVYPGGAYFTASPCASYCHRLTSGSKSGAYYTASQGAIPTSSKGQKKWAATPIVGLGFSQWLGLS